jgi:hypothetical protein
MRTTIASTPSSGTQASYLFRYTAVHEMPEEWGVTPLNMKLLRQTNNKSPQPHWQWQWTEQGPYFIG